MGADDYDVTISPLTCSIRLVVRPLTSNQETGVRFPYTALHYLDSRQQIKLQFFLLRKRSGFESQRGVVVLVV